MIDRLMDIIKRKGIFATLIGLGIAIPTDIKLVLSFWYNTALSEKQLIAAVVINVIAMMWTILPSEIEITGKLFGMKVKD